MSEFMSDAPCKVEFASLEKGIKAVVLSNPFLAVTILPAKGADIYSLVHKATGIDVLWKSPQGLRALGEGRLSPDSVTAWLEMYEGGWQEILPNGGDPCVYKGVELSFHGETTLLPWHTEVIQSHGETASVEFSVRLFRSPFMVRRRMSVNAHTPAIYFHEEVINWGAEPMDFMWGHHPAYGAPFLSAATRLHTNARDVLVDETYDPPHSPYVPGSRSAWPLTPAKTGEQLDLRRLPGPQDRRDALLYLTDFDADEAWYALTNEPLSVGVGINFSPAIFRCLWLWQEVHANAGFAWYGKAYTVAVEPWSSYPGFGLGRVLETTRTHHSLRSGAQMSTDFTLALFDVPMEAGAVVAVERDGRVRFGS
jgi:hypothetical protein